MMSIEFSIIIPVYNVENYIKECIDSVLNQEDFDMYGVEIILVDDGSTDKSSRICDEYSEKYTFVKVCHQNNRGLLQARRTGYSNACGEYILNLDSDDFLNPNALKSLDEIIRKTHADIIFYNLSVLQNGNIKPYYFDVFTTDHYCGLSKSQILDSYFRSNIPVVTSMAGKAIKFSCIDITKDYSLHGKLSFGEDTLQTAEVISNASTFIYLNSSLYVYRIGSGMTAKFDPDYYWKFINIFSCVMQYDGFIDEHFDMNMFYEKVLFTAYRSITQSKFEKRMSYSDRRKYLSSICNDSTFSNSINSIDFKTAILNKKQMVILRLLRFRAYFLIHIALKIF